MDDFTVIGGSPRATLVGLLNWSQREPEPTSQCHNHRETDPLPSHRPPRYSERRTSFETEPSLGGSCVAPSEQASRTDHAPADQLAHDLLHKERLAGNTYSSAIAGRLGATPRKKQCGSLIGA